MNGYARAYCGFGTYPCPILYFYWRIAVRHRGDGIVMIASKEQGTLRDTYIAANDYSLLLLIISLHFAPSIYQVLLDLTFIKAKLLLDFIYLGIHQESVPEAL